MRGTHAESHRTGRAGWLRAAVLGANDGLISTGSLVLGIAAANASRSSILLAGLAGLVAGAFSMAAGEYVSVSSQADTERSDLTRERRELDSAPAAERAELAAIYVARGLSPDLANQVAEQLMARDALAAHARDELGLSDTLRARPLQAAVASALAFATGAAPPVLFALVVAPQLLVPFVAGSTLVLLVALGATAAGLGGASRWIGEVRVTFWGAVAMGATMLVGRLFGTTP